MADLATLRERLSEAEQVHHLLMMGKQEVTVNIGGYGAVTYHASDVTKLETYIAHLKSEISRKTCGYGRRPILPVF